METGGLMELKASVSITPAEREPSHTQTSARPLVMATLWPPNSTYCCDPACAWH